MGGGYALPDHVERINVMGAASVSGNAEANVLQGSVWDDTLLGTGGGDTVRAQFGSDVIDGGDGDDLLDGGGGGSVIATGAGADRVFVEWESGEHVVTAFDPAEDRFEVWSFGGVESVE